jgi:RNA polymerase sigma-70 factor (ECF subfamily)
MVDTERRKGAGPTDGELVARVISGDKAAEEELFQRFSRGVTAIIRANGAGEMAQDLCHETFIITLRAIRDRTLRDPDKLTAFISKVARYVAIEHLRKPERLEEGLSQEVDLPDVRENPFDHVLQSEKADIVAEALNRLKSERDREVLLRFYLAEEDKDQICSDLGLSGLQFNLVLHRARKQFKESYMKVLAKRRH